ncbi:MAG TPA: hypothetical protein VGX03_10790 [Candidatus Binatia bacterium]|jgi:hypothetical protein|nr:hypothetical protein [Candidatus Binatia bacterium]
MTAQDLVAYLHQQGFSLRPAPGGFLGIQPKSKLTGSLRETIRQRKAEILAVLTRPVEQRELWQTRRPPPPIAPPSEDADYHTQRCNAVLAQWRRKDWGPCHRCGQTAWYEHMNFSLCGICTPLNDYGRTVQ